MLADSQIRLSRPDRELTNYPVIFPQKDGCNFVTFKCGDRRICGQFYDQPYKHFGTGVREYGDLSECTVALIQAPAGQIVEPDGDLSAKRR